MYAHAGTQAPAHPQLRSIRGSSPWLTMPAMSGSRWLYSSAVTAPMERPQRPMLDTPPCERRCFTTTARSSTSCAPSVTHLPSDRPEPCRTQTTLSVCCCNAVLAVCE